VFRRVDGGMALPGAARVSVRLLEMDFRRLAAGHARPPDDLDVGPVSQAKVDPPAAWAGPMGSPGRPRTTQNFGPKIF